MAGNKRKNKARNQTTGSRRGIDDAKWFQSNRARNRKREKIAQRSRRANRAK